MIVLASVCVTLTGACVVHHSFLVPIHQTIRMAAGDIPGGPVYRFSNAVGLMMMLFGMPVMMLAGLPVLREMLR